MHILDNLMIQTDFPIRILRENDDDLDILIPIEDRSINIILNTKIYHSCSYIQFSNVHQILLRFSKKSYIASCFFQCGFETGKDQAMFEFDWENSIIELKNEPHNVNFRIRRNS